MLDIATDKAGRWVTVGLGDSVAYSTDGGVSWTTGNTGTGKPMRAVAYGFK